MQFSLDLYGPADCATSNHDEACNLFSLPVAQYCAINSTGTPSSSSPPQTVDTPPPPTDTEKQSILQQISEIPDLDPSIRSLVSEYWDLFVEPPVGLPVHRHISHAIDIEPGASPPNVPPFRMSQPDMLELSKQLQELVDKGLIQPSVSPYGAPVLFVNKKDGTRRLVIDYRLLNKITVKNVFPLPRIHDLLDQLGGAQWFSSIDLRSGYHQVRLRSGDEQKTAFNTPYGHWEFRVMSFGLTNAPATFQNLMCDLMRPFLNRFASVFFDDCLCWSRTLSEHVEHVRQILHTMRANKLYAKLSKCHFARNTVLHLGHTLSKDGITLDPAKLTAVRQWPPPSGTPKQCRTQLLSFLGLCNFYRRMINRFSHIALPLTSLLPETAQWTWGSEQQSAFESLKQALLSSPVVHPPDWSKPFVVHTDASDKAMGAVLM